MENISDEVIHKEIDLIQSCITRMANNSFLIKGWTLSLIAIILALSLDSEREITLGLILLIPIISFWYLDAFFLHTEKMYREMYKWVLSKRPQGIKEYLYDLNPHRFKKEVGSIVNVMFSKTLTSFYVIPIIILIAFLVFQIITIDVDNTKDNIDSEPSIKEPSSLVIIDEDSTLNKDTLQSTNK